jgi:hypothetical protein
VDSDRKPTRIDLGQPEWIFPGVGWEQFLLLMMVTKLSLFKWIALGEFGPGLLKELYKDDRFKRFWHFWERFLGMPFRYAVLINLLANISFREVFFRRALPQGSHREPVRSLLITVAIGILPVSQNHTKTLQKVVTIEIVLEYLVSLNTPRDYMVQSPGA